MNTSAVKHLAIKDWQLHKGPISLYTLAGIASAMLLAVEHGAAIYFAHVLFLSALIIISVHLVFATVVMERKEQTLAFIMSLPVSVKEYTAGKLMICLGLFFLPWLLIVISACSAVMSGAGASSGLVPMIVIAAAHVLVTFVACIAIALMTESELWSIVAVTAGNIMLSPFLYLISNFPGIAEHLGGQQVVWTGASLGFLLVQFAIVAALVMTTFYVQSRKTDFL